ncbi:MAG: HEAT repeat domain-containing protein [Alkalispirochaetaceae bacterium]
MARLRMTLLLLLALSPSLVGQDEPGDRGIPGEALRRRQQEVAAVQARSPDPATQLEALRLLGGFIGRGDESFRRENEAILSYILLPPRGEESPARQGSFAQVRIEAARLAGELDSPRAADILLELLKEEEDPAVLSQAVRSLSSTDHLDPGYLASRFGQLLARENVSSRLDSRLATALINGAAELYKAWGADDPLLVRAVLEARELPYSREARQAAVAFVELVLEG